MVKKRGTCWNKGLTKENSPIIMKASLEAIGRKYPETSIKFMTEGNPNWKGNDVSCSGIHAWIKRHKPRSMFCERCGEVTSKLDCANISQEYKRDISDFRWLCRSCHSKEHRGKEWHNKMLLMRRGKNGK